MESYYAGAGPGITLAAIPNLTREGVTLRYSIAQRRTTHIIISSIDGRIAFSHQQEHDAGTHTLNVPTDALASGLYLVRVTSGSKIATTSVTVVR